MINKPLSFAAGGAVGADDGSPTTRRRSSSRGRRSAAEIDYQRAQAIKYKATGKPLLWDFDDLLMWAEGDVTSPVFNKHKSGVHPPWEVIDGYKRRVRLPQREYLLCSRVTKMQATTNVWEKSTMTTEYDLPYNGELSEGGDVPWAVLVESGQCDLMLISYLGIDFQCKAERVYRLLDTTLTFYGVAKEGQTLEYDIQINSFARQEGQVTMFFFEYNCYVDGKLLIEMRNGVAGFFTDQELDDGKGVVWTGVEKKMRAKHEANQKDVVAVHAGAGDNKPTFSDADMQKLSEAGHNAGHVGAVLGPSASRRAAQAVRAQDADDRPRDARAAARRRPRPRPADRREVARARPLVLPVPLQARPGDGGLARLRRLLADPQAVHDLARPAQGGRGVTFRPVNGQPNKVRCRGQISPHKGKLIYWMEIQEIGFDKSTGYPFAAPTSTSSTSTSRRGRASTTRTRPS